MKYIPDRICHKELLVIIKGFLKPKWGKLKLPPSGTKYISSRSKPAGSELQFEFAYAPGKGMKDLKFGGFLKKVAFKTAIQNLVLENLFLGTRSFSSFIGSSSHIYTKGYSKSTKYYYRLIIPLTRKMNFFFQIEDSIYETDLGYRSRAGLTAIICNEEVYACVISDNNKEYFLSIESRIKQDFDSFSRKANAVKNALGYLTGHLAGNNGYYFAYRHKAMKSPDYFYFTTFRNEILHSISPVNENPYAYVRDKRMAGKYYRRKLLRKVNQKEFSVLCQKLLDSTMFESCLVLMMESGSASLLFRPGGYAIALEMLSDLITAKAKSKISPIKSKSLSKKIREECKQIITKYGHSIDPDDLKTLNIRIEQLNQQTNKARLRVPFDLLGIKLLDADIAILETRNDFLHGRHPDITKAGPLRSERRINLDLFYAATRFYTLLNMLILKWVGFDNYVVNFPVIQSGTTGIKLKEEPYRKV